MQIKRGWSYFLVVCTLQGKILHNNNNNNNNNNNDNDNNNNNDLLTAFLQSTSASVKWNQS